MFLHRLESDVQDQITEEAREGHILFFSKTMIMVELPNGEIVIGSAKNRGEDIDIIIQ